MTGHDSTEGVGRKIRRGILWTTLGSGLSNVTRIAVIAALGRLLTPDEFGVVAASLTVLLLLSTLRDFGVALALVQHPSPTPGHVGTALTISLGLAAVLAATMFLGAPLIASAFNRSETEPFIRALAVLVLLRSAGQVSQQLCQRAMNFRINQFVEVISYAVGGTVAISCAAAGFGPWSLIYGYLAEETVSTLAYLWRFPPGPPRFDRTALRDLLQFGAGQTAAGVFNVVATQGDYVVIARVLGTTPLGFYTRAYDLVQYPAKLFSSVVGTVLFPAFSRLQHDREAMATGYLRTLFVNAAVLMPGSLLLIVVAPEALRILLGAGWDGAVVPFQIMLAGMVFRTSYKVSGIVLLARGATNIAAVTQFVYAATVVGGAVIAVRWGITGVAVTTTLAIVLQFLIQTVIASRLIELPLVRIARGHLPGVLTSGLAALLGIPGALWVREATHSAPLVLVVGIVAGIAAIALVAIHGVRTRQALWLWAWQQLREILAKRRRKRDVV